MSVEQNKATLLNKHLEMFNEGNLSIADEIISPNYVYQSPAGELKGPEGMKQMVQTFRTAFPDGTFTIDDMVGEGDQVAVRYTLTGTLKGEYYGIPPTGKQVNITAGFFYKFENGKEVEALSFMDSLSFYQQLGIPIPENQ
jgi:steroid delta-isomerase-like uncharacterized protein